MRQVWAALPFRPAPAFLPRGPSLGGDPQPRSCTEQGWKGAWRSSKPRSSFSIYSGDRGDLLWARPFGEPSGAHARFLERQVRP